MCPVYVVSCVCGGLHRLSNINRSCNTLIEDNHASHTIYRTCSRVHGSARPLLAVYFVGFFFAFYFNVCAPIRREMTATNPWDSRESELGLRLGDPARVLTIGWKHGLHAITSLQVPSSSS